MSKRHQGLVVFSALTGVSITVRPELRFDQSCDTSPFNDGTRKNQFVFSTNFILHY